MLTGWRKTVSKCFLIPQRAVLAIMGFLAITNAYTMRICLNIAITEMTIKHNDSASDLEDVCPYKETGEGGDAGGGEYEWSEFLQGIILSSFYWGYVITHIPGGLIAEKFGGKWCLSLGILSTAIFTLLTPVATIYGGPYTLIVIRFLEGLGEGTTFPALSTLLAAWVPTNERSKMGSLVFGGGQIGTILGTLISGMLLARFDWTSVFYFFGTVGIIWFIIFTLICYSDPSSHPFIKDSEKEYLRKELGQITRDKSLPPTPWRLIFTNAPMLALICAQVGHDFGFFIMVTDLPKYMSDVLHFSIKSNALFSSLPYLCMWIVSISFGIIGDWLIKHRYLGITMSRKLFTAVAAVGPAIFIMLASYAGCDKTLVVVHFTIAMAIMGCFYPGMKVNPLDLSPNYAGTLMAITNGIGAITGIIAPFLVGVMTPNRNINEWRNVFWIAFVIFMGTTVVYCIWASGDVQQFNTPNVINQEEKGEELEKKEQQNGKQMIEPVKS